MNACGRCPIAIEGIEGQRGHKWVSSGSLKHKSFRGGGTSSQQQYLTFLHYEFYNYNIGIGEKLYSSNFFVYYELLFSKFIFLQLKIRFT